MRFANLDARLSAWKEPDTIATSLPSGQSDACMCYTAHIFLK